MQERKISRPLGSYFLTICMLSLAFSGLLGGAVLIIDPGGKMIQMPLSLLAQTLLTKRSVDLVVIYRYHPGSMDRYSDIFNRIWQYPADDLHLAEGADHSSGIITFGHELLSECGIKCLIIRRDIQLYASPELCSDQSKKG
jgi:hypothetical protein